jgi:hypothetical protein
MSARANEAFPPTVVDRFMNPITSRSMIVSGDYFKVALQAFTYDASGKKGVSLGLLAVQHMRKGEPLGTTNRAEDFFTAQPEEESL